MVADRTDRVVVRKEGLQDDSARRASASRASGNLGQHLEGSFGRTEVGHVEAEIRRDDAHKLHAREVMPLRDHLRPDQDIDLVPMQGS